MSFNTFTWKPDLGAQKQIKPNVHTMKFGDGYEARVANGINFVPMTWTLKFTRALYEATQIDEFLKGQAGLTAFNWTDPSGTSSVYVCRQWDKAQQEFGVHVVSATFEQVFEY